MEMTLKLNERARAVVRVALKRYQRQLEKQLETCIYPSQKESLKESIKFVNKTLLLFHLIESEEPEKVYKLVNSL